MSLIPVIEQDIQMAVMQLRLLNFPIKSIRKALPKLTGVGHEEIARMIGSSRHLVTKVLNGERCNPDVQAAISGIFGITREDLFDGSSEAHDS